MFTCRWQNDNLEVALWGRANTQARTSPVSHAGAPIEQSAEMVACWGNLVKWLLLTTPP